MKKSFIGNMMAVACGAIVMASCSNGVEEGGVENLKQYQQKAYNQAFAEEFATPASDQTWGFGSIGMVSAIESESSLDYLLRTGSFAASRAAATRAVSADVKTVTPKKYDNKDAVLKETSATCFFYLKISNTIVQQELAGVQSNPNGDFYPQGGQSFTTANQGLLNVAKWKALTPFINDNNGLSFATDDQPIPEDIFDKMPSFEDMTQFVPDSYKISIAGSVEAFNSDNYKMFWYVAKWQSGDQVIHIDGILVPKDQITVNVPEYKKRIIVEDLKGNIKAGQKINGSDFDYNDVVFDAITWIRDGKQHLKVIVRAAGGQMPIYVMGKEIHEGIGYMFNTSNPDYNFGKVLIENQILGNGSDASKFDFNSIPVTVVVDGEETEAGANIGQAPEKIAVGVDFKWCKESQNIKEAYPKFVNYVSDKTVNNWWK